MIDSHGRLQASRPCKVVAVAIAADDAGAGLPRVTVQVCIASLGPLPHEHVIAELDSAVLDAIEVARSELADVAITGR